MKGLYDSSILYSQREVMLYVSALKPQMHVASVRLCTMSAGTGVRNAACSQLNTRENEPASHSLAENNFSQRQE